MNSTATHPVNDPLAPAAVDLAAPVDLLDVSDRLPGAIDRKLGYFGRHRYVFFYYEPRGEEVIWNDGQSYGFGSGGWLTFVDRIAPVAAVHGLNVGGSGEKARHVLLIDRLRPGAYFTDRASAADLVAGQGAA